MMQPIRIRPRDREAIMQSLAAGVVPRRGQQHIQVGRVDEVRALMRDIDLIADGGATIRFVIGQYGSGKTFFLHLVRSIALEKGLVTMHADLSPDRRLHATGGQARALYAELTRNIATRTNPDGGAMPSIVERFLTVARQESERQGTSTADLVRSKLAGLSEMVGGYDFSEVVGAYWVGHEEGREDLKSAAVRWLRGEYSTRTDARRDLGVRTIVDDANVYDHLKLMARFVRLAGFKGLLVGLDEMVNLYKLAHTQARNANYEQVLRVVNDCLQGNVEHLGFAMGGTPEFLMDTRRGLYSYEALQTRLAENAFATDGLRDFNGPVIRLASLTPEELYVLFGKLRLVHAGGDPGAELIPDEALVAYMEHCQTRIGAKYFQTPRNSIKGFVQLLSILEQNPGASWRGLLGQVSIDEDRAPDLEPIGEDSPPAPSDDTLTSFTL